MEKKLIWWKFHKNTNKYVCAEGGVHLSIAHTLHLPEPTKQPKSEGCVPPLRSGPFAAVRFGSTWKEKEERRKNNAKFSSHYVRPSTHNVLTHALCSHQFLFWLLPCNILFMYWTLQNITFWLKPNRKFDNFKFCIQNHRPNNK